MPITATCTETLLINGTDIQTWCAITSAEGLLTNPPQRGDIIEQAWTDGAIWQKGPKGTYSFDVPVIMRSDQQDVALGQLRALQAFVGDQVTLTRRLTVNGVVVNEACQAVMASATRVVWNFRQRKQIRAILIFQSLSPWVAA